MTNKPKFLKNLLMTTSALAVIASGVSSASAADIITNGNVLLSTNANWVGAAVPVSGSGIIIGAAGDAINFDVNNFVVAGINVANNLGAMTVTNNVSIGSISGAANGHTLTFAGVATATLTGTKDAGAVVGFNTYNKLTGINFANNASTVVIAAVDNNSTTYAKAFSNAGNATLNVQTDLLATSDVVAGTALSVKHVNIGTVANARTLTVQQANGNGGAVTISGDVRFLNAGSTLVLDSANAGAAATYTINAGTIGNSGDNFGIVKLNANGQTITLAKAGAETLGTSNTNRLAELQTAGADNIAINTNVYAKKITAAGGVGSLTFGALVDQGADGVMKFTNAQAGGVEFANNFTTATIDFNNTNTTITVADGKNLTANLSGDAANAGNVNGTLIFAGTSTLTGQATKLTKIEATGVAGKILILSGAHTATELGATNASTFALADGFNLTGGVNLTANGAVIMNFAGDGTVSGDVGHLGAPVGVIHAAGDAKKLVKLGANVYSAGLNFDTAGAKIEVAGTTLTAPINFTQDGTLILSNANATTITGAVTAGATTGTIKANSLKTGNALRIDGVIANGNTLKSIETSGNLHFVPGAAVNTAKIASLTLTDAAPTLTLGAGTYTIGGINAGPNNVDVIISDNLTLAEKTIFTSSDGKTNSVKTVQFDGDKTLTLGEGVGYVAAGGTIVKTAGAAGRGTLAFLGSSTIGGDVGTTDRMIKAIAISGAADKAVVFQNNVYADGAIAFGGVGKGSVSFGGHVTAAGGITNAVNGKNGTIIFNNATDADVKTSIGTAAKGFENVQINGKGHVNLVAGVDGFNSKAITFAAGSGNLTINKDLGATEVTTAANANNKIYTTVAQHVTGKISSGVGIVIGALKPATPASDHIVNVDNVDFAGSVTTTTDNKGEVTVSKGVKFTQLGADKLALRKVSFNESATSANTFAQTATIATGKKVDFSGTLSVGIATTANAGYGLQVGDGSTVTLNDGIISSGSIYGDAIGHGTVDILGAGEIATLGQNAANTNANALFAVNFKGVAGKIAKLTGDITAGTIKTGAGTIDTNGADRILSALNFIATGTTFDLGTQTLTQAGGLMEVGAGTMTLNTSSAASNTGGKLVVNSAVAPELNAGANFVISVTDQTDGKGSSSFIILSGIDATKMTPAQLKSFDYKFTSANNDFLAYTLGVDDKKNITATRYNDAATGLDNIIASVPAGTVDSANVAIFKQNSEAAVVQDFGVISKTLGKAAAADAMARLTNPVASGTEVISDSSAGAGNIISGRLASVTAGTGSAGSNAQLTQADSLVGVAAGDEVSASKYGAWAMPFYSQAEQKKRKGISGYKAKTSGAVIGFDVAANDRLTVGVAAAYLKTDVKQKDVLRGDKSKVDFMMFSVYGLQQLDNNMFVQAVASFGSGTVKNKSKRIEAADDRLSAVNKIASGKYDSMTYGTEVIGGYNYKANEETTLTPMLGLSYNKFTDSGYTEKGTKNQNLSIAKKSTDKFEGIIGARASMNMDVSGVLVTPEAHAFARIAFNNKAPKLDVRLDSIATPLVTKADKPSSAMYNLGTSVTAKAGMMEYGVGYDATLANKYVGHQGTLKLRVNF